MPTVTGPDGVQREISMEEFMDVLSQEDAQLVGVQRVVSDSQTGAVLETQDIPIRKDGSIDTFGALFDGGFFGGLFDDNRSLEKKIADAENGDEDTMEELAILFLNGDFDVDPDPEQAVYWFTRLAELDNSDAQFNLGLHCAKGHGTPRDFEKAAYWMQRAADNGDVDAPALVEKYRKWAAASEKAATGDAQAMADLAGGLMELGRSLDQAGEGNDFAEAFVLAEKSAAMNNGDGLWTLALAYEHGRGVRKSVKKALECYRKGADLGHAPSQHSLACYFMRGDCVEADPEQAVELCLKSAAQGYNLAYMFLSKAYEQGNGVPEDLDKAIEWGEKAAETGAPDVQYEVAKLYMYNTDDGKMIDAARARYWLEKAATRGYEKAAGMLSFAPMWENEDLDETASEIQPMDDYAEIFAIIDDAVMYEETLYLQGVLPDEPHGDSVLGVFPRIHLKAEAGDEKAIKILEDLKAIGG